MDKRPQCKSDHTGPDRRESGNSLQCMGTGDHYLYITPVDQALRAAIDKWGLLKLRSFCKAKDTVNKTKSQPPEWEKIFTNPTSDRGLKKLDIKIPNNPIKNGVRN